ncbi:NADPH-dependent FMN reductase [Aeromicrobium sp. CTD01-1L150]|uniref:NADPH-dependent FMN reductase n=1 Tax=Aeromicrobium sp. CTD01-1L150 TaxID=3341830 RepID=UPI0035C1CEA6
MSKPTIVTIVASLRQDSFNSRLVDTATAAGDDVATFVPFEDLAEIPPFDEDGEDEPHAAVLRLREVIAAADGVLIATPEYNGSVPGQLKNALDWASRPYADNCLRGKRVAVVGASPSPGGARRALADLRKILGVIGADVSDGEVSVAHAHERLSTPGPSADVALHEELRDLLPKLTGPQQAELAA